MSDCIFCKIISGEIPSQKIYEDEKTYAFLDISNDCLGHTLVIPKTHAENIFDITQEELTQVMNTTKLLSEHYKSLGFKGINIQNNNGSPAGQSVFHFHVHILPRSAPKELSKKIIYNGSTPDLNSVAALFFKKI